MTDQRAEAQRMREGGRSYPWIAAELGVACSTVWRWCNPEGQQAIERRRRPYKRAWENANYRGTCVDCGNEVRRTSEERCRPCSFAYRHAIAETRASILQGMYLEGWPIKEMAAVFERKGKGGAAVMAQDLFALRQRGLIGYRYSMKQAGGSA